MKRAIFAGALMLAAATTSACSEGARDERKAEAAASTTGWTRPPVITAVRRGPATLIFSGTAEPGARVALSNDQGAAFAAAADEAGQFEIRMTTPHENLMLTPETRVGQDAATSPERLLILAGGPIAVMRVGGPSRRLDAAPALGAIDSDGRTALASGRMAGDGERVAVSSGAQTLQVTPDESGRWSVVLGSAAGGQTVRVGDRAFVWPGAGPAGDGLQAERAGNGWSVAWTGPGGGRQWVWLPDR